ncbi:MAG TPA: VCBS repeat-containing protein [Tepidisphaeraceae bacterium]
MARKSEAGLSAEGLERRMLLSAATFAAPEHYPFTSIPHDTAIGDFNGDGSPDIAAVLPLDNQIGILLNNGDGSFVRMRNVNAGIPRAVAAADFDHNGTVDLAVLGSEPNAVGGTVEIFAGNGDGTFAKPVQRFHLTGAGSTLIAIDLNGDGFADLVATTAKRVAVLINHGDGTFAPAVYYASGGDSPSGLTVGDLNNDGVLDLALSRGRKKDVSILLGNPSAPGTFGLPTFFPAGGNASAIALGDFNNDGHLDVAVTNSDFETTALGVLIGNGDGTFRPAAMYGGANFSDAVIAGDFSGTGNQDIVVSSFDSELKLYPGNGNGTFGTPVVVNGGQFTQHLRTADFNSDGRLDLLETPYSGIRILLNTTGTVTPPPSGSGLDKTLGAGSGKSFSFYTPEGTFTNISLSGPGSATLHFTASGTVDLPNGRGVRTIKALTLSDIATSGTTAGTTLSLDVQGHSGSQTINLNSITADSALGAINAPRANISGDIALPGGVGSIGLLSANNGTITVGAGRAPQLSFQQVGNEIINSSAGIGEMFVRLDAGITLTAPSIRQLQVGGSLINSSITLTNGFAQGVLDLGRAQVMGDIRDSAIFSAGNIGALLGRTMSGSSVQAGVAALPPGTLPVSAVDFVSNASIANITLGGDPRRTTFTSSTISASQLGSLNLGRIQTANGGAPFGVAATSIKLLQGTDITTNRAFRLANIASTAAASASLAALHINPQDLTILIL